MCTLRGCQFLHVFFNVCLDLYCHQRSNYQEIQLNGLTLPHFSACSKPGPGFPMKYVIVPFSGYEVVVYFADIGGIVDHHCSNFPFIN